MLDELQGRDIGAICLKGVAHGSPREFWAPESELRAFTEAVANVTKGLLVEDVYLSLRRMPRGSASASLGRITTFNRDVSMHIDGVFDETFNDDGESMVTPKHPLIADVYYLGIHHHITRRGRTTLVMDRLSEWKTKQLARNQTREDLGVADTNAINCPIQGEAIDLTAGDYVALHAAAVYRQPVFVHGTINSSQDRSSVVFTPMPMLTISSIPDASEWLIIDPASLAKPTDAL